MKNYRKKALKSNTGITLIALVITIIVLLILAGISISMLSGDNSILKRATDAKTNTERATVIELAQTDVLGQIAENKGDDLEKAQLKSVLDIYFKNVPDLTNMEKNAILNTELETLDKYGTHTMKVSEIYDGAFKETPTYPVYTLGQEITVGGEKFFVITEDDNSNNNSITLLSKYPLSKTEDNKQHEETFWGESAVDFCLDSEPGSTGYWASVEGITYPYNLNDLQSDKATAVNKAKAYGISKNGIGRLLTYDEANNLKNKIESIIFGTYCNNGAISYYLGSANDYQNVYYTSPDTGLGNLIDYVYFGYGQCTIRPVIEILKTNI